MSSKKVNLSKFTITDNRVTDDPNLGVYEILVYLALCQHANGTDRSKPVYPSHDTIAEKARCSRRTVISTLKKLEDLGYIKSQRRSQTSSKYFILDFQGEYCAGDAQKNNSNVHEMHNTSDSNVHEMHTNNTYLKINNNKKINNKKDKNITAAKTAAASPSNNKLFNLPDPPVKRSRIEQARIDGIWNKVNDTDFLQYFMEQQNKVFPTQLQYSKGKNTNYQVSMFRKNFIDRYQIAQDSICDMIDNIIGVYKRTETDARYRDCFSVETFNLSWKMDKLMNAMSRADQYGNTDLTGLYDHIREEDIPDVF